MNKEELEKRTLFFALKIIEFVATLPGNKTGGIVEFQLVKAGTSVGANYREANRAESRNDFIHKLGIVEKESSEAFIGWNYATQPVLAPSSLVDGCCKNRENYWQSSQALVELARQIAVVVRPDIFLSMIDRSAIHTSQFEIRNPKF